MEELIYPEEMLKNLKKLSHRNYLNYQRKLLFIVAMVRKPQLVLKKAAILFCGKVYIF
jgi:hypothetical protein